MSEGIPYGCLCYLIYSNAFTLSVVHSYKVTEVSMRGCLIAGRDKDHHALFV